MIEAIQQRWGVHFAMGGTGALVAGLVRLIEGQGNVVRCNAEVAEITLQGRRATGVRLAARRADRRRHRGVQRRFRLRPIGACCRPRRGGAGPTASSTRSRYSSGLFVWYFGTQPPVSGRGAPHHPVRSALSGAAARHLRPQDAGRGFQPLSAPADRDRSVAGAAGLRRVLRAVAGAAHGCRHRLGAAGRAVPAGDRAASSNATRAARPASSRS